MRIGTQNVLDRLSGRKLFEHYFNRYPRTLYHRFANHDLRIYFDQFFHIPRILFFMGRFDILPVTASPQADRARAGRSAPTILPSRQEPPGPSARGLF
jgi:hypothetical protein